MYAAIQIPDFSIEVLRREDPALEGRAVAVVDPGSGRRGGVVAACSREAAACGVEPGLGTARALARCPEMVVRERDVEAETRAQIALVDHARGLSPDVEATAPGTVLLDVFAVGDCRRNPAAWRARVVEGNFTFPRQVALGPTPDLAHLTVIAGGEVWDEAVGTGWPLGCLAAVGAGAELLERWQAWGLRTIRDLIALGAGGVAARQGGEAARWHRVVTGREHRPLRLCREAMNFSERMEFDDPIESVEPLLFLLNRMLGTLEARLQSAQRVAVAMDLELGFENGDRHPKNLRIAEPVRTREVLLAILRTYLETVSAPSPVVAVTLDLQPSLPGEAQSDLFRRGLREANRFQETLGRIESLVGLGNVGIPVPSDSHEPDRFVVVPYGSKFPGTRREAETVPLRRFRPPLEVAVASAEGAPLALLTGPYSGRIPARRGPFFLSGAWWENEARWNRAEWDIETADGHLLRLARLPGNQWQVEGVYG